MCLIRRGVLAAMMLLGWLCGAQPAPGGVSLLEFAEHAAARGTPEEDWEPAFKAALAACGERGGTLLVPCGIYRIRRAIAVPEIEVLPGFMNPGRLTIQGGGRFQSVIWQQIDTENVLDWSGPSYQENAAGGTLKDIALQGGKICLNIRWHNQFNLDNCYIAGAAEHGIYAEGWSSRFRNLIVRHCRQAGIRATAHFNDIVIRDAYLSRNKIGIDLGSGNGVRLSGIGLESCSDSAIVVRNTSSVSIRDCYFEGNAHPEENYLGPKGPTFPNVVHLDGHANNVSISGCIFRGGKGYPNATQIGILGGVNHTIRENRFSNCHTAIRLLAASANWEALDGQAPRGLTVSRNDFHVTDRVKEYRREKGLTGIGEFLREDTPGAIRKAEAAGSTFAVPTLSNIGSQD